MQHGSTHAVFLTGDAGVVQTMPALVFVQRRLAGLPSRIPDSSTVHYIKIAAYGIHRNAIISISGDTAELGVFVKIIPASGVGDQTKEIFVSKVIDPRERCFRIGDDVFPFFVIKISVFFTHNDSFSKSGAKLLLFFDPY